jgi:hypothetical protein
MITLIWNALKNKKIRLIFFLKSLPTGRQVRNQRAKILSELSKNNLTKK